MKNRIVLCLALMPVILFSALSAHGQFDASHPVTLQIDNIALEDLFTRLELEFGISIAYGSDNIPTNFMISFNVANVTLIETIEIICSEAGLTYQIIDDVLIFRRSERALQLDTIRSGLSPASYATLNDRETTPVSNKMSRESDSLSFDSSRREVSLPRREFHFSSPKKVLQLKNIQFRSMIPPQTRARRPLVYQAGLFLAYAADFDNFHFLERELDFQTFSPAWNQSFGIGGYVVLNPKVYISLAVGYSSKDFRLDYNYVVLDPDDPFPIPDRTTVQSRYLDFPFTLGYGVLEKRQYSLWMTAGISSSLLVSKNEKTTYHNHSEKLTEHFVRHSKMALYGGSVGVILHRSIGSFAGIFINPGILYCLQPVNEGSMEPGYSTYQIKTGLQVIFSK